MDQLEKKSNFTKVVNTVTSVWVCELQKTAKKNIQNLQKKFKKEFLQQDRFAKEQKHK